MRSRPVSGFQPSIAWFMWCSPSPAGLGWRMSGLWPCEFSREGEGALWRELITWLPEGAMGSGCAPDKLHREPCRELLRSPLFRELCRELHRIGTAAGGRGEMSNIER